MCIKFYSGLRIDIAKQYYFFSRIKEIKVKKFIKNEFLNQDYYSIELIDIVTPRELLNENGTVKEYYKLADLEKDYFFITGKYLDEKIIYIAND